MIPIQNSFRKIFPIIFTNAIYRVKLLVIGKMRKIGSDLFIVFLSAIILIGLAAYLHRFFGPYQERAEISLSFWKLPEYAFFSLSRALFAFFFSFLFALSWGFWAGKDRLAEKILIPLLDILQSIPILGFLPGAVLLLTGLFPKSNVGLELAAILLMFTGQVWNMVFGVYHAIRTVPIEKNECATAYGFKALQRFRWVELPFSGHSLIWNSIMSVAGGWFFLMINEAFELGQRDFRLPGLGSYMAKAADQGDIPAMAMAIFSMIALIGAIDQIVWRPLIAWSQKFRIEEMGPALKSNSWFLQVLKRSLLIEGLRSFCKTIERWIQNAKARSSTLKENRRSLGIYFSRGCLALLLVLAGAVFYSVIDQLKAVPLREWLHLGQMLLWTFSRVYSCVIISTLLMLPLGLAIGLSEKWTYKLEPFLQIAASFPASLLFPILIFIFHWLNIPLGIGSVFLILMGTQWYVLFNVMAGARAMPSDLKEVALSFHYNRMQKFFWLYLPAVFPYLITGILSAAGGAWNASIVAEYVNFNNQVLTAPGIGSSINMAAQEGNIPLLTASIFVMMATVALINYFVWLRLYRYSEKRFALNV